MDLVRAERRLPRGRVFGPHIPQQRGPRRHPLPECWWEALQRGSRHAERPQPLVGEGHADGGVGLRVEQIGRRGHDLRQPAGEGTAGGGIVNP
ncbi:MAG: hypothetical protein U0075_13445 [Thermomicrobiales bacterium]